MHDTAFAIGSKFIALYSPPGDFVAAEVGSQDVNALPARGSYIGIDIEQGRNVDIVATGAALPLATATADIVLASSVFEHDPTFWHTFSELCRITKPGGHIYVSAPANGVVHRFPQDCWRFYPDAGVALAGWGQRSGFEVTLIESFVADQGGELWNDFVAVFVRGPAPDPLPAEFMYSAFSARNIRRLGQDELIEPRALVEDQDLIASAARALIALEQRAATSGAIPRTDAHMRAMQGFARNSDPGHYGDGDFTGEKPNNPFAESYTILDSALTALTAERDQLRAELSSIHEHLRRGLLRRAIRRLRRSVFG